MRALVAATLLVLMQAGPCQAQTPPPKAWIATQRDLDTVDNVWTYLRHKDCAGAARALESGAQAQLPSVLLMAGAMFEQGLCFKPNWERAAGYYERAHAAGHPKAAARIASGNASPAAGPDRAAALWWAQRGEQPMPEACVVDPALLDDPDKFVAALQKWPAPRVDACTYVAGVIGTVIGDTEFAAKASQFGLEGTLRLTFAPAAPTFEIVTERLAFVAPVGWTNGEVMRDRETRDVKKSFETEIRAATERALRRYPKPDAIDPSWRVELQFTYGYVLR
jgi:hypothetical protein